MKLLLLSLFIFTQAVQAQPSSYSEVLDRFHSEKQFNGVVLVATNGTIDFLGSVGTADRALGSPLSPTSRFRIASMSKVFTAVLVMNLVDEGKVRLDVPIREYLPEYRRPGRDSVTIHHLLTYSSGIEPTLDALGMAPYQSPKSLDAFIEAYGSGPLVHTPGSRSVYGNTEYILLHHLIETVTKRRYEAVLEEVIVRPAGLTDTQLITADAAHAGWVPSYLYNDSLSVITAETPYLPHLYFGAGALYSTAEDLLAFDQALFTHRLLSRASTEQLLTLHPDLGYTAYGLWGSTGWGTFREPFYYRTGGIQGSTANWIRTMETGKTILVLSNTNATNLFELTEELYLVP